MGRLFFRIFLWFWLGSTLLLFVLLAGVIVMQPDILASFRFVGQTAMLYVGTQAANVYEREGEGPVRSMLADIAQESRLRVWLYAADGRVLGGPDPLVESQDLISRALANDNVERVEAARPQVLARRVESSSGTPYVILWDAPLRLRSISLAPFSLRAGGLILTGGVVCWLLTLQITRPVRTLRDAARRFAQGELAVRVSGAPELRRKDELSDLATEFDQMAARIEELVKAQQQLLADISHELRSPLARLSLALDLARRRLGDGIPEHQRIEREVHRLNDLIQQLLTLAQLQEQSNRVGLDTVNVRTLVHEVAEDARFEAEESKRQVVVARDCDTSIRGSRALLRSAIENVVRNAVRYTPEETAVTIDMERLGEPARLVIAVRDRGPGVPQFALDRLFDPFFRVDEGRDRESGGVGLGLAITRQAMLLHGGNASAQNHPEGGLLVRLELPAS